MFYYYIVILLCSCFYLFFFFNDTATTEIYTLSLHDALPISCFANRSSRRPTSGTGSRCAIRRRTSSSDRKSTRLNSSHMSISYAVFCLKKKKKTNNKLFLQKQKKNK